MLTVPHRHLQFLMALSGLNDAKEPPPTASSSTKRRSVLGTPARPGPSTNTVLAEGAEKDTANMRSRLNEIDLNSPPPSSPVPPSSKAELLRNWRTSRGRRPFPESLLLRDALYLLQGIDGRYVRFSFGTQQDKQPNGKTHRFDRSETEIVPDADSEVIVGIDIVVDEPKVSGL